MPKGRVVGCARLEKTDVGLAHQGARQSIRPMAATSPESSWAIPLSGCTMNKSTASSDFRRRVRP